MLAALGGCDAQVRGHVAANLTVGNGRTMLLSVLTVLLPFIGYPRTLNALAAINEVATRSKRMPETGRIQETGVVVLITQRSQVQILPRYQAKRLRDHGFRGRFPLLVTNGPVTSSACQQVASSRRRDLKCDR